MHSILIVEDDISIQELLHDFIIEAGYQAEIASDGIDALTKFSKQPFDLVLLDIMLPKINGFRVCEVIRQTSDVPIIILTALDSEAEQIRGLDLKADDYITKPFSMSVLIRKIAAVLRLSLIHILRLSRLILRLSIFSIASDIGRKSSSDRV